MLILRDVLEHQKGQVILKGDANIGREYERLLRRFTAAKSVALPMTHQESITIMYLVKSLNIFKERLMFLGAIIKKVHEILTLVNRQARGFIMGPSYADPRFAIDYNNRGNFYRLLGRPDRAILQFNKAISRDPQFALDYAYRALSYTSLNLDTEAQRDIAQAVERGIDTIFLEEEIGRIKQQRSIEYTGGQATVTPISETRTVTSRGGVL